MPSVLQGPADPERTRRPTQETPLARGRMSSILLHGGLGPWQLVFQAPRSPTLVFPSFYSPVSKGVVNPGTPLVQTTIFPGGGGGHSTRKAEPGRGRSQEGAEPGSGRGQEVGGARLAGCVGMWHQGTEQPVGWGRSAFSSWGCRRGKQWLGAGVLFVFGGAL